MLTVLIPGRDKLAAKHLVLDLNGTLATDGRIPPEVAGRLRDLAALVQIHILTADTFGTASALDGFEARVVRLDSEDQVAAKADAVRALGGSSAVAIGNGMNDEGMLREAALGIVVIGSEGAAVRSLLAADVVITSIQDGLDLLRFPKRLVASLRTA